MLVLLHLCVEINHYILLSKKDKRKRNTDIFWPIYDPLQIQNLKLCVWREPLVGRNISTFSLLLFLFIQENNKKMYIASKS